MMSGGAEGEAFAPVEDVPDWARGLIDGGSDGIIDVLSTVGDMSGFLSSETIRSFAAASVADSNGVATAFVSTGTEGRVE